MHAIVRQGDGKYYVSPVLGYYKDVKSKDDYQRYLERVGNIEKYKYQLTVEKRRDNEE